MAVLRQCRGCGTRNPSTYETCARCRRSMAGSPVAAQRERDPSWGRELVEAARGRAEPMERCRSCGADNPVRFTKCQTCRGSTRDVERPAQRKCASCDTWNLYASRFCEACGDPLAETGVAAFWRPDGCPGCWGDLVAQPGLQFCGTCGTNLPATLLARRALLGELFARRIGGGYRGGGPPPPELHPARCEIVLRDEDTVLWLALAESRRGVVDLDAVVEPSASAGSAPTAPATPSSLVRLARWVRRRVSDEAEDAHAAEAARVDAFCSDDEARAEVERVGHALHVRVACRVQPSAKRLEAWITALPRWALEPARAQPAGE